MSSLEKNTAGTLSGSTMVRRIGSMQEPSSHHSLSANPDSELSGFTQVRLSLFALSANYCRYNRLWTRIQITSCPRLMELNRVPPPRLLKTTWSLQLLSGLMERSCKLPQLKTKNAAFRNHARQHFKLEDPIEKPPKRLKQYSRYTILMEDRVLALESEFAVLTNKPTPAETRAGAARVKEQA